MTSPPAPDEATRSRRIASATIIMMSAMLASRLLGLVRNGVITHQLGQKYEADVYVGAFQIPDLLFYLVAGGALSSAFIPVFTELLTNKREKEAWHVFSTVACVLFVVVSTLIVLGEVFTVPLMHLVNPGFPDHKVAATVPLTRIVLPSQLFFFLGGLFMGAQYSRHHYRVPALGPNVYNLGIILGGLLLTRSLGMAGLCWGALAGAIIGNFVIQVWAVKRDGMQFRISFDAFHPEVMKVWRLMLPVILGVSLPQVSIWVNRVFASSLGNGPQAALTNASNLMQVPLGVFAQALGVAIFPAMSALAAEKRYAELRATSSMGVRALMFLTLPVSTLMIVLAVPIVQLLLQQGRFGADDTALAALAMQYYCVGTFAWSAQGVLTRSFYALQDTLTPVLVGSASTAIFVPMNWLLMHSAGLGLRGLAIATTVAAVMNAVFLLTALRRRLGGMDCGRLAISLTRALTGSGVAAVVCYATSRILTPLAVGSGVVGLKTSALITILASFGLGMVAYVACSWLLRSDEVAEIQALIRRRRQQSAPVNDPAVP